VCAWLSYNLYFGEIWTVFSENLDIEYELVLLFLKGFEQQPDWMAWRDIEEREPPATGIW